MKQYAIAIIFLDNREDKQIYLWGGGSNYFCATSQALKFSGLVAASEALKQEQEHLKGWGLASIIAID